MKKGQPVGCPRLFWRAAYFLRRAMKPVTSEPNPSRPMSGSGEAVFGIAAPLSVAFWSLAVPAAAPLWRLLVALAF